VVPVPVRYGTFQCHKEVKNFLLLASVMHNDVKAENKVRFGSSAQKKTYYFLIVNLKNQPRMVKKIPHGTGTVICKMMLPVLYVALFLQLNLTPQLYTILVERAESLISCWQGAAPSSTSSPSSRRSPSPLSREKTLQLIALDVSRTFPQLCIFQKVWHYSLWNFCLHFLLRN